MKFDKRRDQGLPCEYDINSFENWMKFACFILQLLIFWKTCKNNFILLIIYRKLDAMTKIFGGHFLKLPTLDYKTTNFHVFSILQFGNLNIKGAAFDAWPQNKYGKLRKWRNKRILYQYLISKPITSN